MATAGQWNTAFTGSISVSGIEYINIVGYNYTSSNGLWTSPGTPYGGDNPAALLGSFTLTGGLGSFSNGNTSLVTNTANWTAINVLPPSPDTPDNRAQSGLADADRHAGELRHERRWPLGFHQRH